MRVNSCDGDGHGTMIVVEVGLTTKQSDRAPVCRSSMPQDIEHDVEHGPKTGGK